MTEQIQINWTYDKNRRKADEQYSNLWIHLAYRFSFEGLRQLGYDFKKNKPELLRHHMAELWFNTPS
jgi:hypothetical protein